ncbi:MAG: hypothetical protein BWY31_04678 [Lentisphaerae bacterium ADurb.Bin242]|nr:MAG: hypothetical protein BWY31_04678 [Lentisphaerae bacterium ADurb.Bin242]
MIPARRGMLLWNNAARVLNESQLIFSGRGWSCMSIPRRSSSSQKSDSSAPELERVVSKTTVVTFGFKCVP